MKFNIMNTVNGAVFKVKKHSPELLVIGGVTGMITSAVLACRATTKLSGLLDETKTQVDQIHDAIDSNRFDEDTYSKKDAQKDLAIVYTKSAIKLAKLYGPSIVLGAVSIGCVLKGHDVLRKRNIALAAAYATIDKGYKEYRSRVVERFGEAVDRELRYQTKAQKVTDVVVDEETGKEKKVKRTIEVAESVSEYARFFEEYTVDAEGNVVRNYHWDEDPQRNLTFLKVQQQYANDLLRSKKRLFLNEVYKMLGLPESKAGQVVGWVYDEENPIGDNFVSFGVMTGGSQNYSDFIYGTDGAILLDFNVDGNIWELM